MKKEKKPYAEVGKMMTLIMDRVATIYQKDPKRAEQFYWLATKFIGEMMVEWEKSKDVTKLGSDEINKRIQKQIKEIQNER